MAGIKITLWQNIKAHAVVFTYPKGLNGIAMRCSSIALIFLPVVLRIFLMQPEHI